MMVHYTFDSQIFLRYTLLVRKEWFCWKI